ncbi:aspartate ammonia-lyase [Candidatus Roizmanbacteria bacterium]|nr:aspartate ammonia-lyase [Candidatus Roizmanbacteria bacterium]
MKKKKLYGRQTEQALENFSIPLHTAQKELIYAIVEVKKAAALTHGKLGLMDKKMVKAIVQACDITLKGAYDNQFVTIALQGGAGTSINMNVNEVIAHLAKVHPNDDVNMSQSTNDVVPSALKVACLRLLKPMLKSIENLVETFTDKADEFSNVKKLGRTHIQDALPMTLGEELQSYRDIISRNKQRIVEASRYLYELNLGGTAIGNGINAPEHYVQTIYEILRTNTGLTVKPAKNFMSHTSSQSDFCYLSSVITIFCLDLCKIAADIRFLSSGPRGGIGEIILQPLQPGSSIMPGKVNPVIPETVSQLFHYVYGNNITIHEAARDSHLELAIMFPILADSLISMIKVSTAVIELFAQKCIAILQADEKRCEELLENSMVYATLLAPRFGYDLMSDIVKEAVRKNKTLREVVLQRKLLSEDEFSETISKR